MEVELTWSFWAGTSCKMQTELWRPAAQCTPEQPLVQPPPFSSLIRLKELPMKFEEAGQKNQPNFCLLSCWKCQDIMSLTDSACTSALLELHTYTCILSLLINIWCHGVVIRYLPEMSTCRACTRGLPWECWQSDTGPEQWPCKQDGVWYSKKFAVHVESIQGGEVQRDGLEHVPGFSSSCHDQAGGICQREGMLEWPRIFHQECCADFVLHPFGKEHRVVKPVACDSYRGSMDCDGFLWCKQDVNELPVRHLDHMPNHMVSQTLKFLWLLFGNDATYTANKGWLVNLEGHFIRFWSEVCPRGSKQLRAATCLAYSLDLVVVPAWSIWESSLKEQIVIVWDKIKFRRLCMNNLYQSSEILKHSPSVVIQMSLRLQAGTSWLVPACHDKPSTWRTFAYRTRLVV